MKTDEAKQIPITDLLAKLNHNPTKQGGHEAWYYSPPFHDEKTPSFKVDTNKNLWHDFSVSKGGFVIDLVMELYNYTVSEVLKELARLTDSLDIFPTNYGKETGKNLQSVFPRYVVDSNSIADTSSAIEVIFTPANPLIAAAEVPAATMVTNAINLLVMEKSLRKVGAF